MHKRMHDEFVIVIKKLLNETERSLRLLDEV